MKMLHCLLFVILSAIMVYRGHALKTSGYGPRDLQFADAPQAIRIMQSWHDGSYGDLNLLDVARSTTKLDFFYIVVYVALLIALANWQMQREKNMVLNELLRFSFLLSSLAGIAGIIENFLVLHNFHQAGNPAACIQLYGTPAIKYTLLGLTVLIFGVSVIKSWVSNYLRVF